MAMNRRTARILGAAAAGTAALVTLRELKKVRHRKEEERQAAIDAALVRNRDYGSRRAYLIGGGLASMAAAAYLIRVISPAPTLPSMREPISWGEEMTEREHRKRVMYAAAAICSMKRHMRIFGSCLIPFHP